MALFTRAHLVETRRVHEGDIISLRIDSLEAEDGLSVTREVVEHNGGVVIACEPEPGRVLLVRQYRYSIDKDLLELPAGRIEKDENPLPAAQRELTEETGFGASHWQELARLYSAPGFCNEVLYLYHATGVTFMGKNLDFDEETEVLDLSLAEAWSLVSQGKIQDAKTVAGLGLMSNRSQSPH